jgi:hypothetical protein
MYLNMNHLKGAALRMTLFSFLFVAAGSQIAATGCGAIDVDDQNSALSTKNNPPASTQTELNLVTSFNPNGKLTGLFGKTKEKVEPSNNHGHDCSGDTLFCESDDYSTCFGCMPIRQCIRCLVDYFDSSGMGN